MIAKHAGGNDHFPPPCQPQPIAPARPDARVARPVQVADEEHVDVPVTPGPGEIKEVGGDAKQIDGLCVRDAGAGQHLDAGPVDEHFFTACRHGGNGARADSSRWPPPRLAGGPTTTMRAPRCNPGTGLRNPAPTRGKPLDNAFPGVVQSDGEIRIALGVEGSAETSSAGGMPATNSGGG